jgi:type 1 fimbria pilin
MFLTDYGSTVVCNQPLQQNEQRDSALHVRKDECAGRDPQVLRGEEMTKKLALVLFVAALSAAAFANTTANNTNTVSPTLNVTANVQDAVQLTLSTGTVAATHCAVVPGAGTDYKMDFGTVDALGVNGGNCNKFAPATPGTSPAVYWSDYNLTPAWSGLTATNSSSITAFTSTAAPAGVNIQVPSTGTDTNTTAGLTVATWTTIGNTAGTATPVVSGTVLSGGGADGATVSRFLGLSVSPTAAPGAVNAVVTFTMTIQ